ncbi:glycosyltransferase family 4 protein [Nitrosomonas communis]|uniref:glycosyltransferase family 4 protein n=1 Tax=Nitrosomonas communis TaxID=44574 RepID=UPI003D280EAA
MRLALITDAWHPQVNGVVTTLIELVRELEKLNHSVKIIHPNLFNTRPCPGYPGIDLAIRPKKQMAQILKALNPDVVHIATEGPLGWAARSLCLQSGWPFTSAFHTKFPEIFNASVKVPVSWGYALLRRFHQPSAGVMVPTQSVLSGLEKRGFQNLKPWTHGVDTDLFKYHHRSVFFPALGTIPRPVALFVGRISYEKNIEAFLEMDFRGSKIVSGAGPLEKQLRQRFPEVYWLGILPRNELVTLYASADVFVFPSKADTFGLVLLEAMATGTPVACYPVDGPLEVIGNSGGGAMSNDLEDAVSKALQISREEARARAEAFSWYAAAKDFIDYLEPIR